MQRIDLEQAIGTGPRIVHRGRTLVDVQPFARLQRLRFQPRGEALFFVQLPIRGMHTICTRDGDWSHRNNRRHDVTAQSSDFHNPIVIDHRFLEGLLLLRLAPSVALPRRVVLGFAGRPDGDDLDGRIRSRFGADDARRGLQCGRNCAG